jgi:hypothetical protein
MTAPDQPHRVGAARLHEIAASLVEVGLVTHLHRTRAGTDLTATLHPAGHRDIQVIVDEDGYTELRYWASLSTTPSAAVTTIASALEALTTSKTLAIRAKQAHELVAGYDGAVTERAEGVGMTGPHDHLAEQERIPDQARPHPADNPHDSQVRPDDLQARLERLPLNHPSSPYRDDGSRKPPPPDLTKYELPLPDESDSHPDPDLHADDEARTYPDGSWEWKEAKLSPERSLIADQAIGRCHDTEGRDVNGNYGDRGLTPAMRRAEAQLEHGHLVEDTEKFALKDPDRFKEKFAKLIAADPDVEPAELVYRIRDGVRYTFIYEDAHYSSGVTDVCETITAAGYELYECKNVWVDEAKVYQGVNSTWREPGHDILFEVQVHTPASWHAKQESHPLYEVIESLSSTREQRAEAARRQMEIFSKVPIPPDVTDIPSYRKEGW